MKKVPCSNIILNLWLQAVDSIPVSETSFYVSHSRHMSLCCDREKVTCPLEKCKAKKCQQLEHPRWCLQPQAEEGASLQGNT